VPRVTVAIPCFNHGVFLPETLDSVAVQTFDDYEIIIVNDGSTDEATLTFLNALNQPKTRVITTANRGLSAARNRAITEALGEYVLPLDADDRIAPTYLEKAISILDVQPDVVLVYSDQTMFGEKEGSLALPDYDRRRLLVENLIHASAVFRKSAWQEIGGYCESMVHGWEDWEFWINMSRLNMKVVKLPEPLFFYRVRSSSMNHSLRFFKKLAMFLLIVWRHKYLYFRNFRYVLPRLFQYQWTKLKSRHLFSI